MTTPTIFGNNTGLLSSTYQSNSSGQLENFEFYQITANNTWETAYTVPTGKTFYVSDIFLINTDSTAHQLQFGTTSAQPIITKIVGITDTEQISFKIPLRFSSDSVLQFWGADGGLLNFITIVGWLE